MAYFDGFGSYGNSTNQNLSVTNGNSAKQTNGDSYSGQDGNSTTNAIGNSNSFRRGYSNSLVEGFNFSTTLGASFSTIVGANVPTTGGGKIEHITPWSLKQVLGAWDVDIKAAIQNKVNKGTVYDWNTSTTYESKVGKQYKLKPSGDETFTKQMTTYAASANNIIARLSTTVTNLTQNLGTRIDNVAGSDTKTVVGTHSMTATSHNFTSTMGSSMRMGSFISMNGSMLSFAGEIIQLG
jgi:hypothetical protein